jgi:hypothetical protein
MKPVANCSTSVRPALGPKQMASQSASRTELAIFHKLVDGETGLDVDGRRAHWREASAGQRRF